MHESDIQLGNLSKSSVAPQYTCILQQKHVQKRLLCPWKLRFHLEHETLQHNRVAWPVEKNASFRKVHTNMHIIKCIWRQENGVTHEVCGGHNNCIDR